MTANSQFIPVKALQALMRRGLTSRRYREAHPLSLDGALVKRGFDIVFSLSALILFSPLYLALAALVAVSSPGPIFYIQQRVGKNHRPFNCIKFRTMVIDADEALERLLANCPQSREEFERDFKLRDDPRITWIGRFLRLSSLDEFPQFWNVLMGDMSVVGPRPLVPEELHKYGNRINRVLTIQPGLTGLWQVSGRNDIPYPQRVYIDVYYVNYRTFLMDLWIILKTLGVVLFPNNNGAY
ncbi:MAG: sugar transferase [Cyanobacteriota bacterium]|nr:sugar transferase [Cyanobacteriota bacterium]